MFKRTATAFAVTAAAGLVLAGCSSSEGEAADEATSGSDAMAGGELTLAVFNGWDESLATSLLWENILESKGYTVELEYADPAVVFQGVADGDYDIVTDVWLPLTHASYIEEFGDDMEELGAWFDSAALTVAVNADAPIDSLDELADNADAFGNRIVGIEPGAGLTATVQDAVIPTYGLEGLDFITSSTPAMLSELDTATSNGENIIVTLWEPHWAYGAYDLKNLEDPEGTLGEAESIVTYGRAGISEDLPEVAAWLGAFTMDADHLYDLENQLNGQDASDYADIVSEWVAANQEWVDSLTA
ncbi:glycine betaine ABC transporter substrate-binding protein [Demequina sp. SYSU T00039]|uniref:Glycine betaine ABC transporter substrate-binding protein n=1 Tax=Demequina lignilytica TaxID=3051663 RepID=A0AAW7M218_9MICO|nr:MULTISPECIES: glycine betaine ABC transporter substrate-binding protein [unclassified Demequina]MDN4479271.1 glycine betaine ABC transporter substrate-binding protein [Demequina sp. SYSU T00039-1]MDN4487589.1 glycine betaine ABC transporter substrate-binding protein [Demequina sp. SYSU T00039]